MKQSVSCTTPKRVWFLAALSWKLRSGPPAKIKHACWADTWVGDTEDSNWEASRLVFLFAILASICPEFCTWSQRYEYNFDNYIPGWYVWDVHTLHKLDASILQTWQHICPTAIQPETSCLLHEYYNGWSNRVPDFEFWVHANFHPKERPHWHVSFLERGWGLLSWSWCVTPRHEGQGRVALSPGFPEAV